MFLHLSVSHSVHEGVFASVHAGIHPPGRYTPLAHPRQVHPPLPTAITAAYGTHPTGMLSCFFLFRRSHDTFTGYNGTEIH